jgi:hypothetical protein
MEMENRSNHQTLLTKKLSFFLYYFLLNLELKGCLSVFQPCNIHRNGKLIRRNTTCLILTTFVLDFRLKFKFGLYSLDSYLYFRPFFFFRRLYIVMCYSKFIDLSSCVSLEQKRVRGENRKEIVS